MPRVLATVDESQKAWVESQADSLGSEAEVIRQLIDAGRRDESLLESNDDSLPSSEPGGDSGLIQRLDELEERVAQLDGEREGSDTATVSEAAHGDAMPVEFAEDGNPSPVSSNGRRSPPTTDDALRERLREELPGHSAEKVEGRAEAVLAMRDELRDRGEATRDELYEVVDVEATGYDSAYSFWQNAGREALKGIVGAEPPPRDSDKWRWNGG